MDMRDYIGTSINAVQEARRCTVLFACESGSRAWGFASPDSDWDVRFVYTHELPWYLSVRDAADTIQAPLPLELDLSGWELRKALRLFATCNLAFNEWLGSPIIYRDHGGLRVALMGLIPGFFNPRKGVHHYRAVATQALENLAPDGTIGIKKLFYVLRPLLATQWIVARAQMPPTSFHEMRGIGLAPPAIERAIEAMLEAKARAAEGERHAVPPRLLDWIRATHEALPAAANALPAAPEDRPWQALDDLLWHHTVDAPAGGWQ